MKTLPTTTIRKAVATFDSRLSQLRIVNNDESIEFIDLKDYESAYLEMCQDSPASFKKAVKDVLADHY